MSFVNFPQKPAVLLFGLLLLTLLALNFESVADFAASFKLQDFSIYIKSMTIDLSENSFQSMPHQLTYISGKYGFEDISEVVLQNWGTPLSNIAFIPFYFIDMRYAKLVYLLIALISPLLIASLNNGQNKIEILFLLVGPLLSCLLWGGLGLIQLLYIYLACKFYKNYFGALLLSVVFLYKPQLMLAPILFLSAYLYSASRLRYSMPFILTSCVLFALSLTLYPQSWIRWLARDFSIPLVYAPYTSGITGVIRHINQEYCFEIASAIFIAFMPAIVFTGYKAKSFSSDKIMALFIVMCGLGILLSPYGWLHDWVFTAAALVVAIQLNQQSLTNCHKLITRLACVCIGMLELDSYVSAEPILVSVSWFIRISLLLVMLFKCYSMHHVSDIKRNYGL